MRYVPPEIIGFPVHFEAWFKLPYKGAKLKSYGASLVFRPQIYRFDLCARLMYEKKYLKFGKEPNSDYHLSVPSTTFRRVFPKVGTRHRVGFLRG